MIKNGDAGEHELDGGRGPVILEDEVGQLLSPSLVIDRGQVRRNIEAMVAMARGTARLRPHVKTHKMAEIVRMAGEVGIRKHKCATIAEAEMLARAGAADVLVAYPLVGPNIERFVRLVRGYPGTVFRALVDHPDAARALSEGASGLESPIPVLIDLEVGMGRTGIDPGEPAAELYALVARLPRLAADGLHAYDGHIHDSNVDDRRYAVRNGQEKTLALRERLEGAGLPVPRLVMGGTPSFPIHAELELPGVELECSPGTIVLHDHGYSTRFPDLPFAPAAFLLTRVVSHPRRGRLCLDLGHKAVAADPVGPRVHLVGVPEPCIIGQSEEHLIVETPAADRYPLGAWLLAIPSHICPTVALHRRAYVVEHGHVIDEWEVTARDRVIGI